MGLEANIYWGDGNEILPEDAKAWLVEVRVEQELNKVTKFALRFEDDLCGDGPAMANRPEIAPNTMITVIAGAGNVAPVCLVRGPITRIKSSAQLGGAGSWIEAHCESRQIEMDRVPVRAKWTGDHAQIVEGLLGSYDFEVETANVDGQAGEGDDQLNQSGTDFAFLNKLASEHGVDFWITYGATPQGTGVQVTETAHFKISPPVPDDAPFSLGEFSLSPDDGGVVFRLNSVGDDCPTVNSFDADVDLERPTSGSVSTQDTSDGQAADDQSEAAPDTQGDGPTIESFGDVQREITTSGPGNTEQQTRRQEAALRAASWFVEATATTSTELLKSIVIPHDTIQVEGAGPQLSIPYAVKAVTHVINGAAHMMDIKLRSNYLGDAA